MWANNLTVTVTKEKYYVYSVICPVIRMWISRKHFIQYLGDKPSSTHLIGGSVGSKHGPSGKWRILYTCQVLNFACLVHSQKYIDCDIRALGMVILNQRSKNSGPRKKGENGTEWD
jgi:hypothetical protein